MPGARGAERPGARRTMIAFAVNAQAPSSAPAMYTLRVVMLSPRASGRRTAARHDRTAARLRPAAGRAPPSSTSASGSCARAGVLASGRPFGSTSKIAPDARA